MVFILLLVPSRGPVEMACGHLLCGAAPHPDTAGQTGAGAHVAMIPQNAIRFHNDTAVNDDVGP